MIQPDGLALSHLLTNDLIGHDVFGNEASRDAALLSGGIIAVSNPDAGKISFIDYAGNVLCVLTREDRFSDGTNLVRPGSLFVDASGTLYVFDYNHILELPVSRILSETASVPAALTSVTAAQVRLAKLGRI